MQKVLIFAQMPPAATPQTHYAAGPWCFSGRENLFPDWETAYKFAPEPLQNPQILQRAARQAQALSMAALPGIAAALSPQADDFSPIYWQTLLLPWAIAQASLIVERYLRLKAMVDLWGHDELLVPLIPQDEDFAFLDENDFNLRGCLGLDYNWWLFSRLLELDCPENWQITYVAGNQPKRQMPSQSFFALCKKKLADFFLRLPFPPLRGMSVWQSLFFSFCLLHKVKIPPARERGELFADKEILLDLPDISLLMPVFLKSVPASLKNLQFVKKKQKLLSAYLKVASISAYENAAYRQKLAQWKNAGGRLAYAQHGGNYGQAKVVCNSAIVEYAEDLFFTWGWKRHGDLWGNFLPIAYPLLQRERGAWKSGNSKIIFAGTEMACYSHRLESRPTPLQFIQYREDKKIFLDSCHLQTRKRIFYRPYFNLPGTLADWEWLQKRFPEIRLCKGDLFEQIRECSLLILDHPGTIMLEAFAAGIPTLLFWNSRAWAWTEEGETSLRKLATAGIWHGTPAAAAAQLGKISGNPGEWWQSAIVQNAVKEYCKFQALTLKSGFLSSWQTTLLNL